MSKTDNQIFEEDLPTRVRTKGRPKVNEDLVRLLLESGKYTTKQIASRVGCSAETIRRTRRRLESKGTLEVESDIRTPNFTEADFESECQNARGVSFYEWLSSKRKDPNRVFNFCRKTWEQVWDKPSLVRVRDQDDNLGPQLCIKFLNTFKDEKRSRDRKKLIRQLFTFLGRHDLCDQYLTMTQSRDPAPVKRIPEINSVNFPLKLEQCFCDLAKIDPLWVEAVKFKLVTGCRTGHKQEERGLIGICKGSQTKSYIYMDDFENFQINIFEKMGENWAINWLPQEIRDQLARRYRTLKNGDYFFPVSKIKLMDTWKEITLKNIGIELDLHALRKVFLTWLWVLDIRLEIATRINVGWKDLNTADRHYVVIGAHLQRTAREEYANNIPDWFKDGLEEYISGDARKIAELIKDMM